jgi:hypothetical protein
MKEMEMGDKEEDIYSDEGREELIDEEDEITDVDEGFMKGYDEEEKTAECTNCGALLINENIVEEEIDDRMYRFCSSECATEYESKKNKE